VRGVALTFSRPGKPTDNAFIESLNGMFRTECLNANWFLSLDEAARKCEAWRRDYNVVRPHSRLGWMTPHAYAATLASQRDRTASLAEGFAVRPVAQPAHMGSTECRIPATAG
jgi:putative transposase